MLSGLDKGFSERDIEMYRTMRLPRVSHSFDDGLTFTLRKRAGELERRGIDTEEIALVDRLVGPAPAQGGRPIGRHRHKRHAQVRRLDDRRMQVDGRCS